MLTIFWDMSFDSSDHQYIHNPWLPSMNVKMFEKLQNKIGTKGCKWSSLNATGTETIIHIGSWENSPFSLLALWGNKNGLPSMKVKELEKFQNKMGLKGCKWSSLNAPGTENSLSHPILKLDEFPFSHYWPSGVIRIGSPVWKWKSWKNFRTKWA